MPAVMALFLCTPAHAANPVVHNLEIKSYQGAERLVLSVSEALSYDFFTLENPHRLVLDFPILQWRAIKGLPPGYRGELLRNIRVARFNPTTTRMVLDLNADSRLDGVTVRNQGDGKPFQMIFEVIAEGAVKRQSAQEAVQAPAPQAKPDWGELVEAEEPKPVFQPKIKPLPDNLPFNEAPVPVLKQVTVTQKPIIVIDPGHGGKDPGAIGVSGTREKEVTLEYSRALAQALLRTGRYHVVLTRDHDRYIMLRERLAMGRRAKGDIFISVHADSAENHSARGLSIYTVSETASDKEAAALARRENKVDLIHGMNLSTEQPDVTEILIDLAQRETKNKASQLADALVHALGSYVKLRSNALRHAGFAVLKAPDVPSVLVELGFLSNRKDEALIRSRDYQKQVIRAMVDGIDRYFHEQNFWQRAN